GGQGLPTGAPHRASPVTAMPPWSPLYPISYFLPAVMPPGPAQINPPWNRLLDRGAVWLLTGTPVPRMDSAMSSKTSVTLSEPHPQDAVALAPLVSPIRRPAGLVDEVYNRVRADIMSLKIAPDTRITI